MTVRSLLDDFFGVDLAPGVGFPFDGGRTVSTSGACLIVGTSSFDGSGVGGTTMSVLPEVEFEFAGVGSTVGEGEGEGAAVGVGVGLTAVPAKYLV